MALHILDISCVKPLQPTQRFHLPVSYADSIFVQSPYLRCVFFFSCTQPDEFDLQALKHGLSAALVHFYPLAGRLDVPDGSGQAVTVDCNDAGVEFVEAAMDLGFGDLEEQGFPVRNDLVRFPTRADAPPDAPLLSVQITRFEGGRRRSGIAVGIAIDHVLADGYSLFYFLKSWGECCRGVGVSLLPLHTRALVQPECWDMQKLSMKRFTVMNMDVPAQFLQQLMHLPISAAAAHCKTMYFDSTSAQQIKRAAIDETGNSDISTFQAVIACVWKRLCAGQKLPAHQQVKLIIPANLRSLLLPSLTAAYFGNAVVYVGTDATAGDIERESVGAVAARINKSLKVLRDQKFLRQEMEAIQKRTSERIFNLFGGSSNQSVVNHLVTYGSNLPAFDVDVGMGRLEAVRPALLTEAYGLAALPGKEKGSISVSVQFLLQQSLEATLSIPCPCIDM